MSYGITPEKVAARINGFALGPNTTPSTSTVADFISEATARVNALLAGKGVKLPVQGDAELVVRGWVYEVVVAQIEAARSRQVTSLVTDAWSRVDRAMDQFAAYPYTIGTETGRRYADMPAVAGRRRRGCGCC